MAVVDIAATDGTQRVAKEEASKTSILLTKQKMPEPQDMDLALA
jgi:hypothetical protein